MLGEDKTWVRMAYSLFNFKSVFTSFCNSMLECSPTLCRKTMLPFFIYITILLLYLLSDPFSIMNLIRVIWWWAYSNYSDILCLFRYCIIFGFRSFNLSSC